jgi:hypothetical protein
MRVEKGGGGWGRTVKMSGKCGARGVERYSFGSTTHTRTSTVRSASMWIGTL